MTPGAVGCFLSHRRCWEECVRSGEALLIFEDDVVLAPNFRNIVAAAVTRCNEPDVVEKWDALLLGAFGGVHPYRKYSIPDVLQFMAVPNTWRKSCRVADLNLDDDKDGISTSATPLKKESFIHVPMCPFGACISYYAEGS